MKLNVECEGCGKQASTTDPTRISPALPKTWFQVGVMAENAYEVLPKFWSVCGDCTPIVERKIREALEALRPLR